MTWGCQTRVLTPYLPPVTVTPYHPPVTVTIPAPVTISSPPVTVWCSPTSSPWAERGEGQNSPQSSTRYHSWRSVCSVWMVCTGSMYYTLRIMQYLVCSLYNAVCSVQWCVSCSLHYAIMQSSLSSEGEPGGGGGSAENWLPDLPSHGKELAQWHHCSVTGLRRFWDDHCNALYSCFAVSWRFYLNFLT